MSLEKAKEVQLQALGNFVALFVDNILPTRLPKVFSDFTDYPYDFPVELRCKSSISSHSKDSSSKKVPAPKKQVKKAQIKDSAGMAGAGKKTNQLVEKLEKEAKKFIGKPVEIVGRKRNTRFNGTYNQEIIQNPLEPKKPVKPATQEKAKVRSTSSSDSSDSDSGPEKLDDDEFVFFVDPDAPTTSTNKCTKRLPDLKSKKARKLTKTLSDTSSSSDEEEEAKPVHTTPLPTHTNGKSEPRGKRFYDYSESSSSDEEELKSKGSNSSHNSDSSLHSKDKVVKVPSIQNKIPKISDKNKIPSAKPKGSELNKLTSAFQGRTFDEAMRMYAAKKGIAPPIPPRPPVIPPPQHDPTVKQKKKVVQKKVVPQNSNEHLGGIFTINNGWDKDPEDLRAKAAEEDARLEEITRKQPLVSMENRKIELPPLHMQNYDRDLDDSDLIDHSYDYRVNHLDVGMNGGYDSDEDEPSNLVIDYEEEGRDGIRSCVTQELQELSMSPLKTSQGKLVVAKEITFSDDEEDSDNEEENVESNKSDHIMDCDDDGDRISLGDDLGTLDDLMEVDQEPEQLIDPPELVAELDDLKMKFKIQPIKPPSPSSSPMHDEFDRNTQAIIESAIDLKMQKCLQDYFGDVCAGYLDNNCSLNKQCNRQHELIDTSTLRAILVRATKSEVKGDVMPAIIRFHKLLGAYIIVITEKLVNNNDEESLAKLVKACDQHPRTKQCLRDIVRKVIDMGHWKVHRAIAFIINHHIDSTIARDTIFQMVLDSGPCLPYFMDYIEFIFNKQSIRDEDFDRILHACVAYQNPRLPHFCLNFLQQCPPNRLGRFQNENLKAFLQMNHCISKLNDCREAKLLTVIDKLKGQ